jgi:hypothetical protein
MNKNELKKLLKPLIKECIKEVVFEEGTLSTIISEVVKGTGVSNQIVSEGTKKQVTNNQELTERKRVQLLEQKKKMLDAIGTNAYNGVDLFEGTSPAPADRSRGSTPHGSKALDGIDPNDPGVDLSGFGMSSVVWKKLAGN